MELQKRLHQYDYTTRNEAKGNKSHAFKSGRFRPGVHKVKKVVNWPQDYCTVVSGGRQPILMLISGYKVLYNVQ